MDKIKHSVQNLSLRKSLVLYTVAFVVLALVLSCATAALCDRASRGIRASYPKTGERYYLTNEQGEQLGEGTYITTAPPALSPKDDRLLTVLDLLPVAAAPVYSALCILAAAFLFYRNKLKKPLAELQTASRKIADNDLDFSIQYNSKDELGQLCASFEIMRATLTDTLSQMWRQVEERGQLNAAFAHDLRTPLTVLKGYNEMLQTSEHAPTRETAATMEKHLSRMEAYVSSMSHIRRLEDTQPEYKTIPLQPFLASLRESAEILCAHNGKALHVQNETSELLLTADTEFVSQVCDNFLSNAVRYSETSITLTFTLHKGGLLLTVSDDGKGFDEKSLHKAAAPYYTGEADHCAHFGLGLYICKLLCEHHGGWLRIANTSTGAKVSAFFKSPDL